MDIISILHLLDPLQPYAEILAAIGSLSLAIITVLVAALTIITGKLAERRYLKILRIVLKLNPDFRKQFEREMDEDHNQWQSKKEKIKNFLWPFGK